MTVQREAAAALGVEAVTAVRGRPGESAWWDVDGLATGAVAAFADAVVALLSEAGRASVDGPLVAGWFRQALTPVGWALPSPWDAVAGDYRAADGWIRLHTNAPRHRAAALAVLGLPDGADRDGVAAVVTGWTAEALESAVVGAGGAAAQLRDAAAWAVHPQGAAVSREPLIARVPTDAGAAGRRPDPARPLEGIRVLDLTRVIAGPVATRALALLGAEVLRVDPPDWDEPALVPDMTLGKRAARLDARSDDGRARLQRLLAGADVLVHGYRPGALDALGLGGAERRRLRPGLVDVAIDAYGWTGPWSLRRGFDSLVQMSGGVAERGMRLGGGGRPVPLPVQALDHATGWLAAAAAVAGLRDRLRDGTGSTARLSLARTAASLEPAEPRPLRTAPAGPTRRIPTPWGGADLLDPPFAIDGVDLRVDSGPEPLGTSAPHW